MKGRWRRAAAIIRFIVKYRDLAASALDGQPDPAQTRARAESFREDLVALGPAFIKIGQFLSSHVDFLPESWAGELESLQEGIEPSPFDHVRETIESELKVRLSHAFRAFDETPLGCASLAQVHRAVLRDGQEVAVKIQHPGVADQLRLDMDALESISRVVDARTRIGRRIRFGDAIADMRRTLEAELDFRLEAENLERIGTHVAEWEDLVVPRPHWTFTSRRVLTMDLVEGTRVDALELVRTEHDFADVARSLARAYLDQAFVHGEVHADPHPGNVRVTAEGRLAIFDFGMVAYIPPRRRMQLLKLLLAAVEGRGEDAMREAVSMGVRLEGFDEERYEREVVQLVARYAAHRRRTTLSEGQLVLDLSAISTRCDLRLPAELNLLGKTLFHVQGICEALQPGLDLKPVVEQHLESLISARLRRALSPANVASDLLEFERLARGLPRKLADSLALVAENRLQLRIVGLQDSHLMENLQKIANRVSTGLIVAALLVSSALVMRVETDLRLFGYPVLALALLLVAAALGFGIVFSALTRDRRAKPAEERTPH